MCGAPPTVTTDSEQESLLEERHLTQAAVYWDVPDLTLRNIEGAAFPRVTLPGVAELLLVPP